VLYVYAGMAVIWIGVLCYHKSVKDYHIRKERAMNKAIEEGKLIIYNKVRLRKIDD
jgi:uncharacterized protein YpmB